MEIALECSKGHLYPVTATLPQVEINGVLSTDPICPECWKLYEAEKAAGKNVAPPRPMKQIWYRKTKEFPKVLQYGINS